MEKYKENLERLSKYKKAFDAGFIKGVEHTKQLSKKLDEINSSLESIKEGTPKEFDDLLAGMTHEEFDNLVIRDAQSSPNASESTGTSK